MPYWLDGNNLIGQTVAQTRADRQTRRAFLTLLSGFAATHGGRYTVFFDGDDPDRSVPPRGVQVRFCAPLSADDAILHRLSGVRNPIDVIVVTNDAGLRNRSRDAGAKSMDWRQFCLLMNKATRDPRRHPEKDDVVKIEDWVRFFGFDDDSLE